MNAPEVTPAGGSGSGSAAREVGADDRTSEIGPGLGAGGSPSASPPAGREHRLVRWWALPLLLTLVFLVAAPLLGSGWALFPDSYRYAKQAEKVLGASATQAHLTALTAFCDSRADFAFDANSWVARNLSPADRAADVAACVDKYRAAGDLTTLDPRYQAIFTTRPGYPLLAAPFVGAFGVIDGMRILGLLTAAAGGIATYALLRFAGVGAIPSAAGQAVYLVSPLGWWAVQGLGEGLVNLCVLGAVAGVVLVARGRARAGFATLGLSWCALGVTRFSSLLLIAAALAVACAVVAIWPGRQRRGALLAAAGVCLAAAVATALAMPIFGLPGASVTLQDTFTDHFRQPLVADPWLRLLELNVHFWPRWLITPSASWAVVACALAGAVVLALRRRDLMWIALALLGAGAAQIAAHPLPQEASRLGVLMWIPAVFGLAVLVNDAGAALVRRARTAPVART